MQIQYSVSVSAPQRVTLVPDPCTLLIDGVAFGITSTDILFHMGAEEISWWETCLNYFPFFFSPTNTSFCCWYSYFLMFTRVPEAFVVCVSLNSTPVTDPILCCSGTGSDRFSRILRHMLSQRRWAGGGSQRVLVLSLMALARRYWHPCFCFNLTVSTRCTHPWRTLTWIMRSSSALVRCPSPPMFWSFHLSCVIL